MTIPAPTRVPDDVSANDPLPSTPAIVPQQLTPMAMLSLAVDRNASLEVLDKLMDLQDRAETRQARREFDAAFAAVKAQVGIIKKTGIGHNRMPYATLADIAGALDPVIAQHGLSYRFRSQRVGNELIITCIVCHRAGHYEENSLPAPLDTSGSKNAVQAIGSTCTYLQRYTLIQAFGLAASIEGNQIHDDDGDGAAPVRQPPRPAVNVMRPMPNYDPQTGEILEPESTSQPTGLDSQAASTQPKEGSAAEVPASAIGAGTTPAEEFTRLDREAAAVARTGSQNLEDLWKTYTGPQKRMMKQAFDRRHKPQAERADWEISNELAARE